MVSAAFYLFAIATFIIALSILFFLTLSRIDFYNMYTRSSEDKQVKDKPKPHIALQDAIKLPVIETFLPNRILVNCVNFSISR